MPTYDYRCEACGRTWEKFQSMSAQPEKICPHCNQDKAVRLIGTGAAVIFHGGGFYETDYRSESYKKSAEADKPKSDKPDKSEKSEKKEAKPEPKKDAAPAKADTPPSKKPDTKKD